MASVLGLASDFHDIDYKSEPDISPSYRLHQWLQHVPPLHDTSVPKGGWLSGRTAHHQDVPELTPLFIHWNSLCSLRETLMKTLWQPLSERFPCVIVQCCGLFVFITVWCSTVWIYQNSSILWMMDQHLSCFNVRLLEAVLLWEFFHLSFDWLVSYLWHVWQWGCWLIAHVYTELW